MDEEAKEVFNEEEMLERYQAAAHAMQSGVATLMALKTSTTGSGETSPKHLRVGVNSALSSQGGLANLLISKGIITQEEYMTAITEAMESEVESYEASLTTLTGSKVTLR